MDANINLEVSFGVVIDDFLRCARVLQVTMREDDRRRDNVEHFQAGEYLSGIGAWIDKDTLFFAGGNHVGVCVEWTNDDAFDHTT